MNNFLPYIWLIIAIFTALLELSTVQFCAIWFAISGIFCFILSFFCNVLWIQITVFTSSSVLMFLLTRPVLKNIMNFKKQDTNAGRNIGKLGVVITEINNELGLGQVNISGIIWAAKSDDNSIIPPERKILVKAIEGVKLIVHSVSE
ncbi:MAG: NfeD family protein [Oscillospiraceae bacterium]|nr:NfeD family protein [Oscillospiraceae bacterium]